MAITQEIDLNLIPSSAPVIVHLNQYDTGTGRLIATLYEGNEPYSPNGTAVIQGTKPDGHGFQYSATLDGNVVTADLTEQMSPVAGDVRAQIVVTESSGVTGTFVFIMRVQPSALPSDADMSESDYPLIEEAIREAQEAVIDSHDNAENSEAWAQGTRGGVPVGPTDPTYEHNAEYWAHQAETAASGVSTFNGRSGSVLPMAGDYDSEKILLASALHIGGETQNNVQEALEALVDEGGAGHTILNGLGQEMPQRKNLRFAGANLSDDAQNDTTNVTITGGSGGSTITVTTIETTLYGETVTITDGTSTFTGVFDNSGVCVIDGVTATGTLTVTSGAASRTLNAPYFGNYTVVLSFWAATINVSTDPDVASAIVKKDGVQIDTISFSAGSGVYVADSTGAYTFTATVGGIDFTSPTVNVTQQTTYNTTIDIFSATLSISTSSSELYGKTITIKKGSTVVGTTAFSAQGSATYTVHETGTFTAECEGYSGSATVSAETTYNVSINSVNVTLNVTASAADGTTLTATDGTNTETATISNGKAKFNLSPGDWEVAGIPITVVAGQTYEEDVYVFAVHYSETDSNPDSMDYPTGYDNYGWTPFAMDLSSGVPSYGGWNPAGTNANKLKFFYPKSCMLKYNGERDYYLDEDDESKKEDGVTASDYNNTSYGGNVMMEWGQDGKRLYWKITADTNNDGWTFVVANAEVLGLKPWNHYDVNGDENEHWYTPKYFGSSDGTRMRSISGQSNYVNNSATSEISLAEANNQTNDKIWTTETFCDYMFIGLLCALISKSLNSQAKFGAGRSASGNTGAIGQGTMNGKGQFYGKSNGTDGVKIFGMENFFGNLWRRVHGLININGSYRIKMTYDQTDGSTTDGYNLDGTGYINAGSIGTTATWVYPKHDIVRDNCILAQTNGGSETTYYCDPAYLAASGTFYAFLGGHWSDAGLDGVFCVGLSDAASLTSTALGAALSCKPLA